MLSSSSSAPCISSVSGSTSGPCKEVSVDVSSLSSPSVYNVKDFLISGKPQAEASSHTFRLHSRHQKFQELLLGGAFSCFSIPNGTPLEEILFQIPAGLFRSFLASIEDVQPNCQSLSAQVLSKEFESFTFTFDSGANVHLLSLKAAMALFANSRVATLRITGISGTSTKADLVGHLIIRVQDPASGHVYFVDLGKAYGMKSVPLNLLSVSMLIKAGAVVHFEQDNCYFQPAAGAARIPFQQNDGLFQLQGGSVSDKSLVPKVEKSKLAAKDVVLKNSKSNADSKSGFIEGPHPYCVDGVSFAAAGDLQLWHRRLRHMPKAKLLRIYQHNLVDGFCLRGRTSTSCICDVCAQAKIRRQPTDRETKFESEADVPGHTVSTDVKEVSYLSFQGFRYAVNFVDHKTRLVFVYFMRTKNEVTAKFKQFLSDMERLGLRVQNVQSDRGSEYFENEGESPVYGARRKHEFGLVCESHKIRHIVRPTEMHEFVAEGFWKDSFRSVDAMLWDGRLSPAFWCDALAYYVFMVNRTPNDHLGGEVSPLQFITGKRPRWDQFRVFGADCFVHIPNNSMAKIPGVPKGKKYIFVGFQDGRDGFKVFDLELRRYSNVGNCYFYEDFSSRIDALRHHDHRRALLRRGIDPPIVIDDFQDSNSHAVRNLYLDPDSSISDLINFSDLTSKVQPGGVQEPNVPAGGADVSQGPNLPKPFADESLKAERVRQDVQQVVHLRPLRLTVVGKEQPLSVEDRKFMEFAIKFNIPLAYLNPNPKKIGSASARRYEKYMAAKTPREAFELGATRDDFSWDYAKGFISFPKHEPFYLAMSSMRSF